MTCHTSNNLFKAAFEALVENHPEKKINSVFRLHEYWNYGYRNTGKDIVLPKVMHPGRPGHLLMSDKKDLHRRNMGNREGYAAFVHSLTHIEFEAINLALDLIYRFRDMPEEFYSDWILLCKEECEHYELLKNHLHTLGHNYGDFPVHYELWELAELTKHSLLERLALVPRMAEARGLDVAPSMQNRLKNSGHAITADILQVIFEEEMGHVAIGSKWFLYLCEGSEEVAFENYTSILAKYGFTEIRKPLNRVARSKAGFSAKELNYLENSAARRSKSSPQ